MFKSKLYTTAFLLFLLCSACSTTEEVTQSPKNERGEQANTATPAESSTQQPNVYQKTLSDNLKVDATVTAPQLNEIPVLQVTEKVFDKDRLLGIFMKASKVKEEKGDGITTFTSVDNDLEISDAGSFRFRTTEGNFVNAVINNMGMEKERGLDSVFKRKELDFMTREEAINQVTDVFNKLGITPHLPPQVYALDYATLQDEQDRLKQDEDTKWWIDIGKLKLKDKWDKEDECYYMVFRNDIRGLTVTSTGYILPSSEVKVLGSEIRGIISKNGIVSFQIVGSIYAEQNSTAGSASLISMEQALENLKKKYETIILKDKLTVANIAMEYVPVIVNSNVDYKTGELVNKQMELVPAWNFSIERKFTKGDKEYSSLEVVRINAITGKEIP